PSPPCGRPSHDATTRLQRPQAAAQGQPRGGEAAAASEARNRSLSRPAGELRLVHPFGLL
ncbi:hypothetical protein, partial [Serratia nevei]|uniref:hypothetical protein n=1 Tax=Serratia nevei TaxID=2703794 RepID=UPI00254BE89B